MARGTLFQVDLNEEAALVLLRCLDYGESSVSKAEVSSGVGAMIGANVVGLRKQIVSKLVQTRLKELNDVVQ